MNPTRLIRAARPSLLLLAALALAGCASTPAPTLLTLPPLAATAGAIPNPAADAPVLSVARVEMPEYVVSRRVRYRSDSSTLAEWPNTFWAERIEVGLSREFAAALRDRLPQWRICEAHCAERGPAAALRVTITRMDYLRGERRLSASARIALERPQQRAGQLVDQERRYDVAARGDGPQAQAQAYAELLMQLANDAAASVAAVAPAAQPPSGGARPTP